jgi:hypothetical protein
MGKMVEVTVCGAELELNAVVFQDVTALTVDFGFGGKSRQKGYSETAWVVGYG